VTSAPAGSAPSNPPGRRSLSYRIGTHQAFLRWMLERLPRQSIPGGPHAGSRPLAALATHSERDPTVALLDAAACVADVLTFYQERIANEGFLRTATDPRSVTELARAVGYQLGPGLAASTWLAFTVEDAPGAPEQVVLAPGLRTLSIPGQDERPQTFETTERLVARPEWNRLRPATSAEGPLRLGAPELWIRGTQSNLAPGDQLLIVGRQREVNGASDQWELRTIQAVAPDPASGRTRLALRPPEHSQSTALRPAVGGGTVFAMRARAAAFGHNAQDWATLPPDVQARYTAAYPWPPGPSTTWPGFNVELIDGRLYLDNAYSQLAPRTWLPLVAGGRVWLYWVGDVLTSSFTRFLLTARCSAPSLYPFPDAGQGAVLPKELTRRELLALVQGERLEPAAPPLVDPAWGTGVLAPFPDVRSGPDGMDEEDEVALEGVVLGLPEGRTLIIRGKRPRVRVVTDAGLTLTDAGGVRREYGKDDVLFAAALPGRDGVRKWRLVDADGFEGTAAVPDGGLSLEPAAEDDPSVAEVVALRSAVQTPSGTRLSLTRPIARWYDRATVALHGNVAPATHGETVREALGSGDGSVPNQRFTLARSPLTWVSAATPDGRRSTLEIRVNGVSWQEVASLHDQGPRSRVYLARRDDQGRVSVLFGDGVHGARLPTGQENVVASYRIGNGMEGAVGAGAIALLQTRPLGLRSVTNPLAAGGAEDPDAGEVARREAPASVLALDRIVAVMDYESHARSFAGIGKARAALMRRGAKQRVHVTLAQADGMPVPPGAAVLTSLAASMDAVRDTTVEVELAGFEPRWFRVAARLRVSSGYLFADVAAAAREALTAAYSFASRDFGQGVSAAEIIARLQGIPGVELVDLDGLAFGNPGDRGAPPAVASWLEAQGTRWASDDAGSPDGDVLRAAELLRLDPSPQGLTLRDGDEEAP